ncbi:MULTISPECIES: cell wall-active antibiotics response protein LiaF [Bacillus]|uniref:Cell wall-active antibiotics response protein LiaF n=1 Tax=Bacillus altitudinis TaxID=293387 RepID=A0ABV1S253_BACAB|nr:MULTISPECIES: cell wall-active antibiotics response protein LiaF [Bacillus]AMM90344.1 liaF [Bacillus pumilus]EMI12977.1 transporter yvqf [Bacillus stratosphericus LAMA 585]KKK08696.1 liaF [Bacillus sp. L_1B0_12]KML04561.1 liaF [Bacillus stratosphericus]ALM27977.1 liaF [Bacillus altitudinis]
MRFSRNQILGIIVVIFGINLFLKIIGIGADLFWPVFFALAGYWLHSRSKRWLGSVSYIFAGFLFLKFLLNITFSLTGYLFAAFLIYAGYRLLKNKPVFDVDKKESSDDGKPSLKVNLEKEGDQKKTKSQTKPRKEHDFFIGEVRLMKKPFQLSDLTISGFIGDVKIDLSKAIIAEEESTIVISGLIGDVDIYVPQDIEVCVSASAAIGDMKIIDEKRSGFGSKVYVMTNDYDESKRKVKISISLLIGDVDVRYL